MAAFKTHNFLPEIFQTDTNKKFLNATLDQLTSEPNFKKVSGYIGRKFAPTYKAGDGYVAELTAERQHYQVEPGVVVNNPAAGTTDFYAGYTDLVNKISYYGGNVSNHSRLFENDVYSYCGNFDFDKFVNFSQYYWLPNGPDSVPVTAAGTPTEFTWNVHFNATTNTYYFNSDSENNGSPEITFAYGGVYKFVLDVNSGPFWIQSAISADGFDQQRPNISVRDVFGVDRNGASTGTVTINVPQHDTQSRFLTMPTKASVDYATTLAYRDVQGMSLVEFNDKFGGLDGATGNAHSKTLIFVGPQTTNEYWTAANTHKLATTGADDAFMFAPDGVNFIRWATIVPDGAMVSAEARNHSWVVIVDADGYINLEPQTVINVNEKVYVKSGTTNATRHFYIDYNKLYVVVPSITSVLSTLYYQHGTVAEASGIINLVTPIDQTLSPAADIEGKVAYTSPNNVPFTNGLKVTFDSSAVDPYAGNSYYVTGVGSSIRLIAIDDMLAVESWSTSTVSIIAGTGYAVRDLLTVTGGEFDRSATLQVNAVSANGAVTAFQVVDAGAYTALPTNPVSVTGGTGSKAEFNLVLQPTIHDYLTVSQASIDKNAWARSNRWFHVDVIRFTATFNDSIFLLDQAATAKRPIIEFYADTKLFNHGTVAKSPVAILDTVVTSAYTQINAVPTTSDVLFTTTVEGTVVALRTGDRVIFSNDLSQNVCNKIYQFNIVDISNDPLVNKYIGRIAETADTTISAGTAILATCNSTATKEFWYDGTAWNTSQHKATANQAPLFDVFDKNGVTFSDSTYYTNTNFVGTKIFSYKIGSGPVDPILGIPLSYRSVNNVGDIQFTNDFDSASFTYLIGPVTYPLTVNSGFLHSTTKADTYTVSNGWVSSAEKSKQYQLTSHTADGVNNVFEIDVLPEASSTYPNIKVLVNSKYLLPAQYGMTQIGVRYAVVIETAALAANDSIDILIYSTSTSSLGFYQVPANLDNNAENANFTSLTLGQMRNHLTTLFHNSLSVTGTVPGSSNLRDMNVNPQGGSILKHSAPLLYSELFLVDSQMNFIDSIALAQREYVKFKNKYLEISTSLQVNLADIPATADRIIKQINGIKNSTFAWYYSDMVPQGDSKTVLPAYTILDPRVKSYQLSSIFDDASLSNKAVLIYLTRTTGTVTTKSLLAKDQDYVFDKTTPSFTISSKFNLNYDDVISVVEYSDTDGNYVPETPTKLGLYPKFIPSKYFDNTYLTPMNVIQGHDGSLTPAFDDYRDDLLLELELRIYNNIKVDVVTAMNAAHVPGKFRLTDYSRTEYNQVLTNSFLSWAGANRVDFTTNKNFSSNNPWTWNYKNFRDTLNGEFLPGSWRAVFLWLYDTMRPHTHPWEMLGFSNKPDWWQDRYGPAPYTGGNLPLWTDLSLGYIHAGPRAGIDVQYARGGLLQVIPVDDAGNLLSPEKFAVLDFDSNAANASFAVGDVGVAEAAWRKSSDYAFAIQIATALTKPAMYFGLNATVDRYNLNAQSKQYVSSNTNQHIRPTSIEVNGDTMSGSIVRTAGYINWISDYLKNLGISDPQTKIKTMLKNVTVQLNYKVAGYTDKKFLKILAEQGSPSSTNTSIVIPDENYRIILNKSVPVDRIVYSAVIVEKSANGYTVSGYNLRNPYFTIIPSQVSNNAYTITVGESVGTIFKDYLPVLNKINYGYEFNNAQQVVDFLVGYQRFLQSSGFVFVDNDPYLNTRRDWVLSAKEFLTWAQQGWQPGNILVLSPVKDTLRVASTNTVVDEIVNLPAGAKLLDPNFGVIKRTNFTVVRVDNNFTVTSSDGQTIALADLSMVQYEHVIIFDNTTVFNDIIYSADTGNRQYRLKFIGYKTADWTGVMNPPGFVFNSPIVDAWQSGKDYRKGQLVVFKDLYYTALTDVIAVVEFDTTSWTQLDRAQIKSGLLPNFATNAKSFESIYDIDNQPFDETLSFYSNGLVGFRERNYLTDLLLEAETQSKFYQGYIKQKGTTNAVAALASAEINGSPTSINVYEEWALRVGEYGATDSNQFVEVVLNDLKVTANPALLQFLAVGEPADSRIVTYYPADLHKASRNNSPSMFDSYVSSADKLRLPSAGYPRLDDVDATIFDLVNYRELSSTLSQIGTGYTIWCAKDFSRKWNVFRVSETGIRVTALSYNMDNVATVTVSAAHDLTDGDVIALKGFSSTINDTFTSFDGFYQVFGVVDSLNFTIVLVDRYITLRDAKVIYDTAILFKLVSSRIATVTDISAAEPIYGWTPADKIWVDTASAAGWGVYQRTTPWTYTTTASLNISEYTTNDLFGASIESSSNGQFIYVGAPTNGAGRVACFVRQASGTYIENASWAQHSSYSSSSTGISKFGNELSLNDRTLVIAANESNGGKGQAYIYAISNGVSIDLLQALASPNPTAGAGFGTAMCSSQDGNWLYISEPGVQQVHAYHWISRTTVAPVIIPALSTSVTLTSPAAFATLSGGDVLIPGIDYIVDATGYKLTFTPALTVDVRVTYHSGYKLHSTLTASSVTGDNFGASISCDLTGRIMAVGASESNGTGDYASGVVHLFDRSVENFIVDTSATAYTALRPIGVGVRVLVDNVDASYTLIGNSVQFNTIPAVGSIVSIESNEFTLITTLASDVALLGQRFGAALDLSRDASSLYVGAPAYSTVNYHNGVVYKFDNLAKLYNTVTGTQVNPTVTASHGIRINGVDVIFGGSSLASVVNSINSRGIPGISAKAEATNLLSISSNNISAMEVLPGVGTAFTDLGLITYAQSQTIKHPESNDNESFGTSVRISADNHVLAVASTGATTTTRIEIDSFTTEFDSGSTAFNNSVENTGAVYMYDLIDNATATRATPSYFEFTQELQGPRIDAGIKFGAAIALVGKSILVGAAADPAIVAAGGTVLEFTNTNLESGWNLIRSEEPQVDYASIAKALIYNKNTQSIVANLDIYDPAKGKILGVADQDLTYKSEQDPAVYNSGLLNLNPNFHWSSAQVGNTWWDLSSIRYINYEQGSLDYKNKHWGEPFPGSTVAIYEWVESSDIPSNYIANGGNGIPKDANNESYATYVYVEATTGLIKTKYYFWVREKTTVDVNLTNRTNSVFAIQQIVANPKDQLIPYISAIAHNAVSLSNVNSYLLGLSIVLHIDHTPVQNTNIIHTEYELIKENANTPIPQRIISKLQDSLAGVNFAGQEVPDPNLGVAERYGIEVRPRQTIFVDRFTALANFVKYVNSVFTRYPIANLRSLDKLLNGEAPPHANIGEYDKIIPTKNDLSYIVTTQLTDGFKVLVSADSDYDGLWTIYSWITSEATWTLVRIQSYLTSLYFEYIDWYAADYDATVEPTFTVATYPLVGSLQLAAGNTIKVLDDGAGKFAVYRVNVTAQLDKVGSEEGSIQILPTLYDLTAGNMGFDNDNFDTIRFDQNPKLEARDVFSAVEADLFTGDLQIEFNKLFFSLVNYVYTEQPAPDWIFKSSFISVEHNIRELAQYPSYIKDNQTYYEDYINEVKPYRTVIREYLPIQSTIDYAHAGVTDFDLPSYYDSLSGTYRSPNGSYSSDAYMLATDSNYIDWNSNHLYKVVAIEISSGGTGYTLRPSVTISGGGGSGATAEAALPVDGQITSVTILNPGSGYTSIPTITVNGNGTGAKLVSVLLNEFATAGTPSYNTVRSIDTTLKFDRVSYTTSVIKWSPNMAYAATLGTTESTVWLESGTLISYDGDIYLPVQAATTNQAVFDYTLYDLIEQGNVLIDANNRISGYYAPESGMPGFSLTQTVNGVEYPGVEVQGTRYSEDTVESAWVESTSNSFFETGYGGGNIALPEGYVGGATLEFSSYINSPTSNVTHYFLTDDFGQVISLENDDQILVAIPAKAAPITIAGNIVDSTIASYYSDTLLGTRPEDILIDGGAYYDTFSSHAPEELLPGRVYETLDIQVLQCNTPGFNTDVFSINSITIQDPGYGYDDATSLADKLSKGVDVTNIKLISVTIDGIGDASCEPTLSADGKVTSLRIVNPGRILFDSANPIIKFAGTNIAPAKATAILSQDTYELVGWRDFYDMNGRVSYTRIHPRYTTTLAQSLHLTDTTIYVTDISVLSYPSVSLNEPGRIFIDGELITFYGFDVATSSLTQIRRAAEGTGAALVHLAGRPLVDAGTDQIVPNTSYVPVVPDAGAPEVFIGDNITTRFTTEGITTIYPDLVRVQVAGKFVTNFKVTKAANQIIVPTEFTSRFVLDHTATVQSISVLVNGHLRDASTLIVSGTDITFNTTLFPTDVIIISFNALQITFVKLGANPSTPGFMAAAPAAGAEIIISAAVEGIWENHLATTFGGFEFNGLPWEVLVADPAQPNPDPVMIGLGYPYYGGIPSNDYVITTAPPLVSTPNTEGNGLTTYFELAGLEWEVLAADLTRPITDPTLVAAGFPYYGGVLTGDYVVTASTPTQSVTDGGGLMLATTEQARFIRGEV